MKRPEDYDGFTQALAWRLLAEVSLDEETFGHVAELCFGSGELPGGAAAAAGADAGSTDAQVPALGASEAALAAQA